MGVTNGVECDTPIGGRASRWLSQVDGSNEVKAVLLSVIIRK